MGFLDAVAFLTRVPVGRRSAFQSQADVARTAVWFPVVGALLGAGLLLLAIGLVEWTSVLVAVVLVVIVDVLITGALHLDGLADTADGTGGADRESRLRIMKDHATGVYGTAAVSLALLLQFTVLVALVPPLAGIRSEWYSPTWSLASAPTLATLATPMLLGAAAWSLSRAAMLPVALLLPYAREDGTGRGVIEGLTLRHTLLGWVLPAVLCVLLGWIGLAMLAGALVAAALVGWLAHRLLGGATGDVLGATAQLALLGALVAATLAI